jgi:hypothetical protein
MTSIPLVYSFGFMLVVYVLHIIDESRLGGSFVEKVQQHWWPQYSWRKFFWFNTGYLLIMSISIVLYDRLGSAFLFLPVEWPWKGSSTRSGTRGGQFTSTNMPGLLTSLLMWLETYFIVFCQRPYETLSLPSLWPGLLLGLLAAVFLTFSMPFVGKLGAKRRLH